MSRLFREFYYLRSIVTLKYSNKIASFLHQKTYKIVYNKFSFEEGIV